MRSSLLTKKQLKTIGFMTQSEIPSHLWNPKAHHLFKPFDGKKNSQNQTYDQFMNMTLDGANTDGTGRFRQRDIEKIEVVFIERKQFKRNQKGTKAQKGKKEMKTKKKMKKNQISGKAPSYQSIEQNPTFPLTVESIVDLLHIFFQVPVRHNTELKLCIDSKTNTLIDETQNIEFWLDNKAKNQEDQAKEKNQATKKEKTSKDLPPAYDIWQLMQIGWEYQQKLEKGSKSSLKTQGVDQTKPFHTILLFLIEADLLQDDRYVDGRATGDGVAFISFTKDSLDLINSDSPEFIDQQFPCYPLPILIHECLHTLGFDHCSWWECLMNSVTNDEFLLCPSCARKLQSQLKWKISFREWYEQLEKALIRIKNSVEEKFGQNKMIKMLADLVCSKRIHLQNEKKDVSPSMLQKTALILKNFQ